MHFISFEGIDGSGKSSTIEKVELLLKDKLSIKIVNKRDIVNNKNAYGIYNEFFFEMLNDLCWNNTDKDGFEKIPLNVWIHLHAAWYNYMYERMLNSFAKYDIVLIDGWFYKILARMMITSYKSRIFSMKMSEMLPKPDCIIFLNVNPQIAWERRNGDYGICELGALNDSENYLKNKNDPLTQFVRFQNMVSENILKLIKKTPNYNIKIGNNDINSVANEAAELIWKYYDDRREKT